MSVYCVNSGNAHSTLYVAENAEHGQHVGLVIFLITGFDTSSPVFSGSGYDDVEIRPTGGYEWDGIEANLTAGIGSVNSSADSLTISHLGVKYYNAANGPLNVANNCLIGHTNTGGTVLSAGNVNPAILNNCVIKGTIKTTSQYNGNLQLNNCSIVSANGYGAIRATTKDSVILNTGSATVVQGSEINVFSDDGAGGTTNNLAESDFVDYANGDYRLKSSSAAALAGAGAFIEQAQQASDHNASITGAIGGYSSSMTVATDKPSFSASIVGGIGGYTSSVSITTSKPRYDAAITGSIGGYSSGMSLSSGAPGFNLSASGDIGGYGSSMVIDTAKPEFNLSANGDVGGYGSSMVVGNTNVPQFNSAITGSVGGYTSSMTVTNEAPDRDMVINDQAIGGYDSHVYTENDKPVMPAAIAGDIGGYTSSVTLVNGELNIVTPPQNIVNFAYQSTIVEFKTASRIANV